MLLSYHQRTQQYTACKKATLFYIEPNTFGLIFNYSWLVECDSTLLIYYPPKHLVTSLEKHPAVYPAAGCFSARFYERCMSEKAYAGRKLVSAPAYAFSDI